MTLITDSESLAAFCARQRGAAFVTIDTEFLRDQTYWPILCLVQVAGPEEAVAIDSLAEGLDLAPLAELLQAPETVKVMHSGRQDMEIFFQRFKCLPEPLFDSQVAAMVCGFGEQVAYDTLARKLAGVALDKSSRFTDWARRPLTERQLAYALADVTHLRPIYEKLRQRLVDNGRGPWIDDEMALLTSPSTYDLSPERAWQRLKVRSNDRRYLGRVKALAAWREREAQRRDVPRGRIIRDEQLFEVAAHAPKTVEELGRTRGLSQDFARGKMGQGMMTALAEAVDLPRDELPKDDRSEVPPGLGPLLELFKVLLKAKAEKHEVAQKLIASSADLEAIAADDSASVPALEGWRRELFGADALALKHGQLALTSDGKAVKIVTL